MIHIKLLQEWDNIKEKFAKGVVLEMEKDSEGQELIDLGIAELHETPKTVKAVKELNDESMAIMVAAAIKEALATDKARVDKTLASGGIVNKGGQDAEYIKTGGFKHFGEFLQDVAFCQTKNFTSQKLTDWAEKTAGIMAESDDTEGGFLVPIEFNSRVYETAIEAAILRPRTQFIPMQTNTIEFPSIDVTSHATSLFGGIIIYRTAEGFQKTKSKPKFGQLRLTLNGLTGLVEVTNQLLEDSPISIEPLVNEKFSQAIVHKQEDDFINGTGVGQALGVLNSPCLVTVTKETGQVADTILSQNIIKMFSRLHPTSMANAIWIANNDTFIQLAQMTIDVGTGGVPVWLPANGISGKPFQTLFGMPLFLTEHCQTLGDKGDIILGDWSQYLVGGKNGGGVKTASSMHLRFDYNAMVFRIETRYDGQPWWRSALTPKHSNKTLSPFVTLGAR